MSTGNRSSQGDILVGLNIGLVALTLTALTARVGRRVIVIGTFSHHDVLISLAAISAFTFSVLLCVGTTLGLGKHGVDIDPNKLTPLKKLLLGSNVFYFLCNWFVKHALLVFYADITREKKHLWSIYFMHFVAFGFGFSSILVNLFQCRPFHKAYDANVEGYCVNLPMFFYFNASVMIATDVVLYAMPVVFTWNLQLRRPQRIGLNCLFALGGLVLLASAARVISVHYIATKNDFLYWFANAMIWSVIENHLAISVACAPSIKVLALLVFPRLMSSYRKVVSRVTSTSRTRSGLGTQDLESSTAKSDKLRSTLSSTPLPSPALTAGSRGSRRFGSFFRSPKSPQRPSSADSMERGLAIPEESTTATKESDTIYLSRMPKTDDKAWSEERRSQVGLGVGLATSPPPSDNDIVLTHTIDVESARESSENEVRGISKAH